MNSFFPLPLLKQQFADREQFALFFSYLEPLIVRKGQFLFHKGDRPDGVYLIASGQVSAVLELPGDRRKSVQTFESGEIVGEGECYCAIPRQFSIVADQPSALYHLSNHTWDQIELEAPDVAIAFHRYAFGRLSSRLRYTTNSL